MEVALTNVHLDLGAGRRGTDMGPSALHVAGLVPRVRKLGHTLTDFESIASPTFEERMHGDRNARFLPEIAGVCARLADRVQAARAGGRFPLVLGGDHAIAIGTITGLARVARSRGERVGVIWIDAHTDMNTPQTSHTGNIHGMPLACLLGHGPPELTSDLMPDGPALEPRDVTIIGVRDVDPAETKLVRELGVRVYTMSELDARGTADCLREAVAHVQDHTSGIHLSFDLDGVDPNEAPGVGTPVPGGLNLRESHLVCEMAAQSGKLIGMEMVELNPTRDVRNRTGELACWLIESALGRSIL
jgi:arginase